MAEDPLPWRLWIVREQRIYTVNGIPPRFASPEAILTRWPECQAWIYFAAYQVHTGVLIPLALL
jgi:hypothetical protein